MARIPGIDVSNNNGALAWSSVAGSGQRFAYLKATEKSESDFHAEFRRSSFGMTFGLPFVADHVRLLVRVEGVRQ